jgi:branched-chain amino acid transport system permease protein
MDRIDPMNLFGFSFGKTLLFGDFTIPSVTLYYYLFLVLVVVSVVVCYRLQDVAHRPRLDGHPRGRDRRQGDGHQHAQHEAAGLRHGRHLRRRVGRDVRGVPGLRLARELSADGVVMIVAMVVLGGMGHIPGVILGRGAAGAMPEALRYVAGPSRT